MQFYGISFMQDFAIDQTAYMDAIKLHLQVILRMNTWIFEIVEDTIIKLKHYCKKGAFCWFLLHNFITLNINSLVIIYVCSS
jgi:hypothetical protein